MRRLLIDVGNTRIKWAVQVAPPAAAQQQPTKQGLTAQALAVPSLVEQGSLPQATLSDESLRQQLLHATQVAEVLVANVAGERWRERLTSIVQACFGLTPRFVTAGAQVQVAGKVLRNAYHEPHKLGVDRWLALQAAAQRAPHEHLLVASVGTALTLDALDVSGQHLGGLIVPGAALMVRSLMQGTSDIAAHAQADVVQDGRWFGDNTLGCVELGAQHAVSAVIAAAHAQLATEGRAARLFITGGGAASLSLPADLQSQSLLVNDLVLEGLALNGMS